MNIRASDLFSRLEGGGNDGGGGEGGGSSLYSHAGPGERQCFSSQPPEVCLSQTDSLLMQSSHAVVVVVVVVSRVCEDGVGGQTQADVHGILMACVAPPLLSKHKSCFKKPFSESESYQRSLGSLGFRFVRLFHAGVQGKEG